MSAGKVAGVNCSLQNTGDWNQAHFIEQDICKWRFYFHLCQILFILPPSKILVETSLLVTHALFFNSLFIQLAPGAYSSPNYFFYAFTQGRPCCSCHFLLHVQVHGTVQHNSVPWCSPALLGMYWEHIGWNWRSYYFLVGEIGHKSHMKLGGGALSELQCSVVWSYGPPVPSAENWQDSSH